MLVTLRKMLTKNVGYTPVDEKILITLKKC
jgi:hypothetical protein